MAKMPIYDSETNKKIAEIEIPDDVLAASEKVGAWIKQQPMAESIRLNGLMLAEEW